MALKTLLKQLVGLTHCQIVATEPPRRVQNIEFIKAMRVEILPITKADLKHSQYLAVLDAQPTFLDRSSTVFIHRSSSTTTPSPRSGMLN